MSAFFFTNRLAPIANEMVIIAGNASGIAATATEIVMNSIFIESSPLSKPKTNTIAQITNIIKDNFLVKFASLI